MAAELAGLNAVVTGGASGIGDGIVRVFAEEGASVVIADIDDTKGERLAAELGARVVFQHTDVNSDAEMAAAVARAVSEFGSLDIFVNNAGVLGDQLPLVDVDADRFTETINVLLRSAVLGHKYAARQMIAQGGGGSIVSVASIAAIQAGWSSASYDSAKAGILRLASTATHELAKHRIRSNVVLPGLILTPIMAKGTALDPSQYDAFTEALVAPLGELHPMGRAGLPRDIANAALYFAGPRSEFVTAQFITVDGGITAVSHQDMGAVVAKTFTAMGLDLNPNFSAAAQVDQDTR